MDIISEAKKVLEIEKNSIEDLIQKVDDSFVQAIELMLNCKGRVIVMGVGKSGQIGRKISSTLASTGTPSFFVHPGEGMHGDLGMVSSNDIVILISNSGETEEVLKVIPTLKRMGVGLIALAGKPGSTRAQHSDIIIDVGVKTEASTLGIVPTASTTATLAMGDALASVLLKMKGFDEKDFAFLHPGGSIGKKLLLKVDDVMHTGDANAVISLEASMKEVIVEISSKGLGATSVINSNGKITGIVTDGDLRRACELGAVLFEKRACDIMTPGPKTIAMDKKAYCALKIMEQYNITSLVVTDNESNERVVGLVHIHDLVKAGIKS